MRKLKLAAILLSLAAMLAHAQEIKNTLYVNPSGNDANDGSASSPFQTLATALGHLTNDTRLVITGSFTNECVPSGLGLPVSLAISNLSNVEIIGVEGATMRFTGYGNGLHLRGFTNLIITGLTFVGDRPALRRMDPSQLNVVGAVCMKGTNSGLFISGCKFLDWPDQAITVWGESEAKSHLTDNVWVQNNVFQNIGTTNMPAGAWTPGDGTCLSSFFRNHVWVQNNYATNCLKFFEFEPAGDNTMANVVAEDWHITDNVLMDHMGWLVFSHHGYGVSSRNIWIERNYLKQSIWCEVAVNLRASTNVFIRNNTFVSVSAAIQPQMESDNVVVEGNTFDGGYTSVICGEGLSCTDVPCWNLTIRDNTFRIVHNPLILGAVNMIVENNTFAGLPVGEPIFISVLNGGHVYGPDLRGWATNLTFDNNSFFPPFNSDSQFWLFTAGSNRLDNFTFRGNRDYCATPVTTMFLDPPGTYARSNMFIDQPAGSTGTLNGNVQAATGSRWEVDGVTYVNTGDAVWEPESPEATEPMIISQPVGQSQIPGLSATFTVRAGGTPPLSFQWRFNGEDIPDATGSSFTVTNVQSTNLGTYSVLVANSANSIVSSDAPLEFGQVAGWGAADYPTFGQITIPLGDTNLLALAAGHYFSMALKADGTLQAWGDHNLKLETALPEDLTNVVAIAAGGDTGLALKSDGTVAAWGDDGFGQADVPPGLTNVVAIAAGSFHSLALKSDGTVVAWGGTLAGETIVPVGLTNVVAIAAGSRFSVALKADGRITAWGYGLAGPPNLTGVVGIAAGIEHALALLGDGTVVAWGQNSFGQTSVPKKLSNVVAIAGGAYDSLALLANGTVVEWGANSAGQTNPPTGLTNVVAIAAGDYHSLALVGSGPPVLNARISNPTLSENGFSVSLPSQSGRVYALEYKNSLPDANWTALPLAAGNGNNLVLTDATAPAAKRFYRVRRW